MVNSKGLDKLWKRASAKDGEATVGYIRMLVQDVDSDMDELYKALTNLFDATMDSSKLASAQAEAARVLDKFKSS